jgi:hypothetical protein
VDGEAFNDDFEMQQQRWVLAPPYGGRGADYGVLHAETELFRLRGDCEDDGARHADYGLKRFYPAPSTPGP